MYKHILIPTDGSDLSGEAALSGVRLARALGAKVTAFFAAPAPTPMVYRGFIPVGYTTPDHHENMIEKTAERYLGVIQQACAKAKVPCESVHVTDEFPADAIIRIAKKRKCDLIFIPRQTWDRRCAAGQ